MLFQITMAQSKKQIQKTNNRICLVKIIISSFLIKFMLIVWISRCWRNKKILIFLFKSNVFNHLKLHRYGRQSNC